MGRKAAQPLGPRELTAAERDAVQAAREDAARVAEVVDAGPVVDLAAVRRVEYEQYERLRQVRLERDRKLRAANRDTIAELSGQRGEAG